MRVAFPSASRRGVGAMKALLATWIRRCRHIHRDDLPRLAEARPARPCRMQLHALARESAVRDRSVLSLSRLPMPDAPVRFEPSVPGRFPMPGFPDDRVSLAEPSRQDAAPDVGAEKAAPPALAAAVPEPSAGPATTADPGAAPPAVSAPSLDGQGRRRRRSRRDKAAGLGPP